MLCCLLLAALAQAADSKALLLAKEADKLYKENRYKKAAGKLGEAYAIDPSPLYLYNMARAYDQAGEIEKSLDLYRRYVGSSEGTQPDLLKKANLSMDRLRTLVAKSEAEKKIQEAETKRLEDETARAQMNAESEAASAREQRKIFEAKQKATEVQASTTTQQRFTAALIVGGVSLASFGTSIAFGLVAASSRNKFREAPTVADKQRFEADTKTQALICDAALLLGVATAVTAVIVFPKGSSSETALNSVAAMPIPGGVVASIEGRF
jgi:tetratricopeptide (TPR) repeat protein